MTGHACPECGRRTAGEPGTEHRVPCRCGAETGATQLMGDELRAARSAEMAAAEDFDPLRIRPYVTLGDGVAPESGDASGGPTQDTSGPTQNTAGDAATTMPLHLGGGPGPVAGPGDSRTGMGAGTDSRTGMGTAPYPGADAPSADASRRRTAAMGAGPGFGADPGFGTHGIDPVQPRRRRPFAALAVGAAVAAVVGTAAFAGGLFGGDGGQDEALPEATTSAPDTTGEPAASVAPSSSPSAAPSRTASASPTPSSASASPSPSASPSESASPSPTASASATPTAGAPSAPVTGSPDPDPPSAAPPAELAPSSLRRGDQGPQVADLQNRLKEVWLYHGPTDANFNDRVENAVRVYQSYKAIQGDPAGVYGPDTRSALEAETTGQGRD